MYGKSKLCASTLTEVTTYDEFEERGRLGREILLEPGILLVKFSESAKPEVLILLEQNRQRANRPSQMKVQAVL
jgi:hypothetical protein